MECDYIGLACLTARQILYRTVTEIQADTGQGGDSDTILLGLHAVIIMQTVVLLQVVVQVCCVALWHRHKSHTFFEYDLLLLNIIQPKAKMRMVMHFEGLTVCFLLQTSDFYFAHLPSVVFYSSAQDCSCNIQERFSQAVAATYSGSSPEVEVGCKYRRSLIWHVKFISQACILNINVGADHVYLIV